MKQEGLFSIAVVRYNCSLCSAQLLFRNESSGPIFIEVKVMPLIVRCDGTVRCVTAQLEVNQMKPISLKVCDVDPFSFAVTPLEVSQM